MRFNIEDNALTVELEGAEVLLSLRRKVVIPRGKIAKLEWKADYKYQGLRVIRLGGMALPRTIFAGNFWGPVGWYFLYVRRPSGGRWLKGATFTASNILDITTKNYTYKRVIVDCPPETGAELVKWFRG